MRTPSDLQKILVKRLPWVSWGSSYAKPRLEVNNILESAVVIRTTFAVPRPTAANGIGCTDINNCCDPQELESPTILEAVSLDVIGSEALILKRDVESELGRTVVTYNRVNHTMKPLRK